MSIPIIKGVYGLLAMQKSKPTQIELKWNSLDDVPDDVSTPGKIDAARYIIEEVLEQDRWPVDYSVMADESGWSRQHIKNTIDQLFESADNRENNNVPGLDINVHIPEGVDVESYLRGYLAGYME